MLPVTMEAPWVSSDHSSSPMWHCKGGPDREDSMLHVSGGGSLGILGPLVFSNGALLEFACYWPPCRTSAFPYWCRSPEIDVYAGSFGWTARSPHHT